MDETIKVTGLSKSYAGNKVISNIELSIGTGQVFGLLGANGAGKTTTIECILGTRKADAGSVSILGLNPRKDRKQLFEQVGVQFQEASYSDKIKVWELCEETACLYRKAANYEELLRQFGLWEKRDAFVNELSGGQKQRLFIVLALLPDPRVVFLDELTTGLDTKARSETKGSDHLSFLTFYGRGGSPVRYNRHFEGRKFHFHRNRSGGNSPKPI